MAEVGAGPAAFQECDYHPLYTTLFSTCAGMNAAHALQVSADSRLGAKHHLGRSICYSVPHGLMLQTHQLCPLGSATSSFAHPSRIEHPQQRETCRFC